MTPEQLQEQLDDARAEIERLQAETQTQERDSDISYWQCRASDLERGLEIARTGLPIPASLRFFFKYGGQRRLPVNQASLRRY